MVVSLYRWCCDCQRLLTAPFDAMTGICAECQEFLDELNRHEFNRGNGAYDAAAQEF